MNRRILIIGGTGVFGKRLARHLVSFIGIDVLIASRSLERASAVVKALSVTQPSARFTPVALDRDKGLSEELKRLKPFAVIDCSGPFQGARYDVAHAVIAAGAHLIDLADARDYLAGFSDALDQHAKGNGVAALTGASSTPTLSACVVRQLTEGWQQVESIDCCITPGGKSEVGRAVIEAILSYAGRSVPVWLDGRLGTATGWRAGWRVKVPNLGARRVAPVETYDAEYLGPRHRVSKRVSFAAGLESPIEQRGIETLAWLRERGILDRLTGLIPILLWGRKLTRLTTSDRGGMVVTCSGRDAEGRATRSTWSLLAEQDHGPYVPILPAATALDRLLRGSVPPGARIADDCLKLEDITAQMAPYAITTETA